MPWQMYALAAVASYALIGIAYSSRLRCWARGHDEMKMFTQPTGGTYYERSLVWHCKRCLNRRPVVR